MIFESTKEKEYRELLIKIVIKLDYYNDDDCDIRDLPIILRDIAIILYKFRREHEQIINFKLTHDR